VRPERGERGEGLGVVGTGEGTIEGEQAALGGVDDLDDEAGAGGAWLKRMVWTRASRAWRRASERRSRARWVRRRMGLPSFRGSGSVDVDQAGGCRVSGPADRVLTLERHSSNQRWCKTPVILPGSSTSAAILYA